MSTVVSLVIKFAIADGKLEEVQKLSSEIKVQTEETEPDTLLYEFYLNQEKTVMTLLERYADEDAILFHMKNGGEIIQKLLAISQITSLEVFGAAAVTKEEIRTALEGMGATFHDKLVGFAR